MTGSEPDAATQPADPIKEPPADGPSTECRPLTETIDAGSLLWRVHRAWHIAPTGPDHVPDDGTLFNPGYGAPTRFGPFKSRTDPAKGRTVPLLYPRCTRWGAWLHEHVPTAAGLTWRSRQDNSQRAYLFFGDRITPGTLAIPAEMGAGRVEPLPIGHGHGLDWVRGVAASVRVKVSM